MSAQVRIADPTPASTAPGTPRIRAATGPPFWVVLLERLDLAAIILTLFGCLVALGEPLTVDYAALAVVAVVIASRRVTAPNLQTVLTLGSGASVAGARLLVEWASVAGLLLLAGFTLKISDWYSRSVVLAWFVLTPVALVAVQSLQIAAARWLNRRGVLASRHVIVGVTRAGVALQRRLSAASFLGYFDFRGPARLAELPSGAGRVRPVAELGDFVRANAVTAVYVALPVGSSPRIRALLDDLRNSTASVYLVPDVFAFELLHPRIVDLNGMPAIAVCDTPLHGTSAAGKRLLDVTLATLALMLLAPAMLVIAVLVKRSSPGPVLFRQRRYGLAGEEIHVLKFRTMTVCEDGPDVRQASAVDARVTAIGRILRRTSLDELPQLLNVLGGSMSLVGPRPHAVAHNEQYRQLIGGYMLRHKVRPGITGLAQVNGLRGETRTVEDMARRVRYDLEYLNRWSLLLDVQILLRTPLAVLQARNAY